LIVRIISFEQNKKIVKNLETFLVFRVSCLYLHRYFGNLKHYKSFLVQFESFINSIKSDIMRTTWTLDSSQSDVLIKMRHSIIAYIGGTTNKFDGFVDIEDNEIEDASVEFSLDINNRNDSFQQIDTNLQLQDFFDVDEHPIISFKSTSFQKINNNINFFKGDLTIKDVTKVVELDAEFIGVNNYNGERKVAFEIKGDIKRQDFGLDYNSFNHNGGLALGKDIKLIANLEFSI
jgi:polyisoprenoid-binding protein YceI